MSDKDCEELRTIREEKRMLSMTVENMKSEMTQVQAKVKYEMVIQFNI